MLTGSALEEADFSRASITHSLLNGARMDNSLFSETDLQDSRFVNAVVTGADFSGARNIPPHLQEMIERE
ncbi:hypothetical protein QQ73_09035 [Candidatus Endoriftia persephone str. Guaymas]|nr:hypothetical protein [Candidatus Endoriftia persephone str. Guaymas]